VRRLRRALAVLLGAGLAIPTLAAGCLVLVLFVAWRGAWWLCGHRLTTWLQATVLGWAWAKSKQLGLDMVTPVTPRADSPSADKPLAPPLTWMDWNGAPWRKEPKQ
jgi:hypothetical protein